MVENCYPHQCHIHIYKTCSCLYLSSCLFLQCENNKSSHFCTQTK